MQLLMEKDKKLQVAEDAGIYELNQLSIDQLYTYADYLSWKFKERVELIKGRLFKMSPAPSSYHQLVSGNLQGFIWQYFRGKNCQVFAAPFDVRLPKNGDDPKLIYNVVQPDLCVVCDPQKLDERGCLGAPDWVIEILSPGNSKKEFQDKYLLYEESGVQEYWMVDLKEEAIFSYVLNEERRFIGLQPRVNGTTVSPQLFPDLQIPLAEVFQDAKGG